METARTQAQTVWKKKEICPLDDAEIAELIGRSNTQTQFGW